MKMQYFPFLLKISFLSAPMAYSFDEEKDDKLVLKPAELVDLILEHARTAVRADGPNLRDDTTVISLMNLGDLDSQVAAIETECTDDGETLRGRKVWSRWSKWGACSVSCGEGVMTRARACVAGRCARGEREEQRRACLREPCRARDAHDSD